MNSPKLSCFVMERLWGDAVSVDFSRRLGGIDISQINLDFR